MSAPPVKQERPIRVWLYYGWCSICRVCQVATAVGASSQQAALSAGIDHLRSDQHLTNMPLPPNAHEIQASINRTIEALKQATAISRELRIGTCRYCQITAELEPDGTMPVHTDFVGNDCVGGKLTPIGGGS